MNDLFIVYVPTSELKPNSYNPNVHDARSFDLLINSLSIFGFTQPIVVDRNTMEIIDGENRWRAACVLKIADVPVCFLELSDDERRAATLLHNRARGREMMTEVVKIEGAMAPSIRKDILLEGRRHVSHSPAGG